ncbi:hypothetical protein DPMN_177644 [Dreissena polymorpha]|uniref:Uncharacterized protein n=1 Tax=Dreissena polymorpha TaxID=45954 RepID=A0A9D4IKD6_DREPO|nr:hypothetical protein DPMN_177644 [Dreissena polymorpha]
MIVFAGFSMSMSSVEFQYGRESFLSIFRIASSILKQTDAKVIDISLLTDTYKVTHTLNFRKYIVNYSFQVRTKLDRLCATRESLDQSGLTWLQSHDEDLQACHTVHS